jgi:membrane peptidoglycan carboxypeptidase
MKNKTYEGIDQQYGGAMTPTANIIRDAWVFGILPEDQTCAGWTIQGIEDLYDKVTEAWHPYGHLVSRLPPELRERHERIYSEAIQKARAAGWDPELGDND